MISLTPSSAAGCAETPLLISDFGGRFFFAVPSPLLHSAMFHVSDHLKTCFLDIRRNGLLMGDAAHLEAQVVDVVVGYRMLQ